MTGLAAPGVLAPGWYDEPADANGADPDRPGLYEWHIDGACVYVGKYTHARRPRREYGLNVAKLLGDRPYRKGNQDGFRAIHRALQDAVLAKRSISLRLVANHPVGADPNRHEGELIARRRQEAARDGRPFYNTVPRRTA